MAYEITPATAENVIASTEAVLLRPNGADAAFVAQFLDIPQNSAEDNLKMACQLQLLSEHGGTYTVLTRLATYLVTPDDKQRASLMRLLLDLYEPFRHFRERLLVTGNPQTAAQQVKAIHNLSAHRDVIKDSLVNLGTFAGSIITRGAGRFELSATSHESLWDTVATAIGTRDFAEMEVRRKLGSASEWVNTAEVIDPLIEAFMRADQEDARSVILYVGNAVEAFLCQLGDHYSLPAVRTASGLNSKANSLDSASKLTKKHKAMLGYIGHLRNAADHGPDSETGVPWTIESQTALEVLAVAISTIRALVAYVEARYVV